MGFIKRVYELRREYFENLDRYLEKIKDVVKDEVPDAEIYLYGSVIENKYSIGLSDIDIAVVSDKFIDRDVKLDFFGKITKKFLDSPFEFHVLTKSQWNLYKNFIKKYIRV